jgi:Tol biopolymer transport system component
MLGRKPLRKSAAGLVPLVLLAALLAGCGATKRVPVAPKHFGLVYLDGSGEVTVASARGAHPRALGPGTQALLAPDGTVVAALVGGSGGSQTLTTYQTIRRPRPRVAAQFSAADWTAGSVRLLAWSPDSRFVALTAGRLSSGGEQPELVVVNVTSGKMATVASGNFFGASFSPGLPDRLVYSRATVDQLDTDRSVLFTAEPDGANVRAITTTGLDSDPVWGAKGIVFARLSQLGTPSSAPRYQLWIVQPNGSGLQQLTHIDAGRPASGSTRPALSVSANGTHIVANFFSPRSSSAIDVWTVDLERRQVLARRLSFAGAPFVAQGISRDGTSILLMAASSGSSAAPIDTQKWGGAVLTQLVSAGSDPSRNH